MLGPLPLSLQVLMWCCILDAGERSNARDMSAELSTQRAKLAQKEEQLQMCTQQLSEASKAAADSAASAER